MPRESLTLWISSSSTLTRCTAHLLIPAFATSARRSCGFSASVKQFHAYRRHRKRHRRPVHGFSPDAAAGPSGPDHGTRPSGAAGVGDTGRGGHAQFIRRGRGRQPGSPRGPLPVRAQPPGHPHVARFERDIIDQAGGRLPADCGQCTGFGGAAASAPEPSWSTTMQRTIWTTRTSRPSHGRWKTLTTVRIRLAPQHTELPPHQGQRAVRALLIPGEGWVNPRLMLEKLDMVVGRHPRVRFVEANARRIRHGHGAITGVVLDDEQVLEADKFVLATGASAWICCSAASWTSACSGCSTASASPWKSPARTARTPIASAHLTGFGLRRLQRTLFHRTMQATDHILIGASSFTSATPVEHARIGSVESC